MLRLTLGALALLLAAPAQAQFIDDLSPSHLDAEADEAGAPPAEGIQVHGRWTITVREPDGALVEKRVFQNELTLAGAQFLTLMLLDQDQARALYVQIQGGGGDQPCFNGDGTPVPCVSIEPDDPRVSEGDGPNYFETLTASPILGTNTYIGVSLIGSVTISRESEIRSVQSGASAETPSSSGYSSQSLTRKVLDTPIPVTAGQTVDVRVEITFE